MALPGVFNITGETDQGIQQGAQGLAQATLAGARGGSGNVAGLQQGQQQFNAQLGQRKQEFQAEQGLREKQLAHGQQMDQAQLGISQQQLQMQQQAQEREQRFRQFQMTMEGLDRELMTSAQEFEAERRLWEERFSSDVLESDVDVAERFDAKLREVHARREQLEVRRTRAEKYRNLRQLFLYGDGKNDTGMMSRFLGMATDMERQLVARDQAFRTAVKGALGGLVSNPEVSTTTDRLLEGNGAPKSGGGGALGVLGAVMDAASGGSSLSLGTAGADAQRGMEGEVKKFEASNKNDAVVDQMTTVLAPVLGAGKDQPEYAYVREFLKAGMSGDDVALGKAYKALATRVSPGEIANLMDEISKQVVGLERGEAGQKAATVAESENPSKAKEVLGSMTDTRARKLAGMASRLQRLSEKKEWADVKPVMPSRMVDGPALGEVKDQLRTSWHDTMLALVADTLQGEGEEAAQALVAKLPPSFREEMRTQLVRQFTGAVGEAKTQFGLKTEGLTAEDRTTNPFEVEDQLQKLSTEEKGLTGKRSLETAKGKKEASLKKKRGLEGAEQKFARERDELKKRARMEWEGR